MRKKAKKVIDPIDKYFGVKQVTVPVKREKVITYKKKYAPRKKLSEYPKYACDFDEEKNGISADRVSARGNVSYWWKCSVCGHEWKTTCGNRVNGGTKCPSCIRNRESQSFR